MEPKRPPSMEGQRSRGCVVAGQRANWWLDSVKPFFTPWWLDQQVWISSDCFIQEYHLDDTYSSSSVAVG